MDVTEKLEVGRKYSKRDLARELDMPQLVSIQGGLYNLRDTNYVFLFVTLEKVGVDENFHYNNFFEGEVFHWDSQNRQDINTPMIRSIVTGEKMPLLFARLKTREKNITLPFVYCGRLEYEDHIKSSSFPVHIMYKSLDYKTETTKKDLLEIYEWKPESSSSRSEGKSSKPKKRSYKKPSKTERRGLITSRIGQGYYRQLVIGKWKGKCAINSCDLQEILIASHIVPWRDSTEEERLDPDNGILLSPVIDALFDKHLISFNSEGHILISEKFQDSQRIALKIDSNLNLKVDEGMQKYLDRHRAEFLQKQGE